MAEQDMNKNKIEDVNKPQHQDIDKDIDTEKKGNVEQFPGKQQDIKQQDLNKDKDIGTEKKQEDLPEKEAV
jgi:hypothetical protein